MTTSNDELNGCGCCAGSTRATPASIANRPGLRSLSYRIGTHARFKQSMLAALTSKDKLRGLTTRADDDPAIALLDAWAATLDVLSFYQERIANEGFLRTADERRSIRQLARAIGYELRPGVAASTWLAFTLQTAPGAPTSATIPEQTRAQSLPGQDEKPQTFETTAAIKARADWQDLRLQLTEPATPVAGDRIIHLQGVDNNLQVGDTLLLVGQERITDPGNNNWDFRRISSVSPDREQQRTTVQLDKGLGSQDPFSPPAQHPEVHVLRQQAALFGSNAPDWQAMPQGLRDSYDPKNQDNEWPGMTLSAIAGKPENNDTVYLDALYPKIVSGSWVVLARTWYVELYQVQSASGDARTGFALSAKTTRLNLSGENLYKKFDSHVRDTLVYAQSERLQLAPKPRPEWIDGNTLLLDQTVDDLAAGQPVAITGIDDYGRQVSEIAMLHSAKTVMPGKQTNTGTDKAQPEPAKQASTSVHSAAGLVRWTGTVAAPGAPSDGSSTLHRIADPAVMQLATADNLHTSTDMLQAVQSAVDKVAGFRSQVQTGVIAKLTQEFQLTAMTPQMVQQALELFIAREAETTTRLVLAGNLEHSYKRASVRINANVAPASHGETTSQVLGSGAGAQRFQTFELNQKPLTHVSADTANGSASTLQLRVDDVLWQQRDSFHDAAAQAQAYTTRYADDGTITVKFGDGIHGARLPTGSDNITAEYRVGIGLDGMVARGQINQLMSRPLGVDGVTNPTAPVGGADAETRDNARNNAPLTVQTLDRIISVQDFENFARAFVGIEKACATELWDGQERIIHLTLAGAQGSAVPEQSQLHRNLHTAIDAVRPLDRQLRMQSYRARAFGVQASLRVDGNYREKEVVAAARAALLDAFSFQRRAFGQGVAASELIAVMQQVAGVVAVNLETLDGRDPLMQPHLTAGSAQWSNDLPQHHDSFEFVHKRLHRVQLGLPIADGPYRQEPVTQPAELLTLNADKLQLTTRSA